MSSKNFHDENGTTINFSLEYKILKLRLRWAPTGRDPPTEVNGKVAAGKLLL